jgi:hypothetical protein
MNIAMFGASERTGIPPLGAKALKKETPRAGRPQIFWDSESPAKPIPGKYLLVFFGDGEGCFCGGFCEKRCAERGFFVVKLW